MSAHNGMRVQQAVVAGRKQRHQRVLLLLLFPLAAPGGRVDNAASAICTSLADAEATEDCVQNLLRNVLPAYFAQCNGGTSQVDGPEVKRQLIRH